MNANVVSLPTPDPALLRDRSGAAPRPVAAEEALSSEVLLKGRREILIRHGDRIYRLRHTSNDKLILTK